METGLTKLDPTELAQIDAKENLDKLIKPLVNEIHLFDSFVAGTSFLEDKTPIEQLKIGDVLALRREDNKFDTNAILILNEQNQKLGYVPEKDNIIFARLLDAGKCLQAKVTNIQQKRSFTQITIGIYLVDF